MAELERLTAALMELDGSVTLAERSAHAMRLQAGPQNIVLLEVSDLASFEAEARGLSDSVQPGQNLTLVAIDVQRLGAAGVLERVVPSTLTQVRSQRIACVWVPGEKPVIVRGVAWKNLELAVKALDEGRVGDPAAIIARRADQAGDVQAFIRPLLERKPVVTWAVAGVSAAVFGLQLLWGNGQPYVSAPRMGAAISSAVWRGEVWRLLAPMLLHGSFAHVAMNLIALFGFGTFLERYLGWRRYLVLYVLSGLGGSVASVLRPGEVVSVGASGGIWGLMIAGAVLVTWPRGRLPALVSQVQRRRAWTPVGINVLYSFQPGIDLLAHFGGGIIGGLLVFTGLITAGLPPAEASNDPARPPLRESPIVKLGAAVAILALVASLAAALVFGRPWELRSTPALTTVAFGPTASAQLPMLTTPPRQQEGSSSWVYGGLQQDPVAFVVVLPEARLSDDEAADPKGTLSAAVRDFNPGLIDGFKLEVKTELRDRKGRPYLYHRQVADDGRTAESHFLIEGHRMATVMVLISKGASSAWREAADRAPFSLELPQVAGGP
ncbi:MAG: rhomboid family intramembrane serine protease [Myxococcaceae bacterium]|nr:rhomboid family intramembrane serine protease [Myxococcaceae bacterium]